MADVPEGAQRSEDGQYWWDGEQWQSVDGGTSSDGRQYSEDGQYHWDGGEWKSVSGDGSTAAGGTSAGGTSADEPPLDLSQYPTIQAFIETGDPDAWLRMMGLDPDELASSAPNVS